MRGADILEVIVRYGWKDGLADRECGISVGYAAKRVTGVYDGRKIAARVRRLVDAGLILTEKRGDSNYVRPTARGIEVDRILEKITAKRGGTFQPWNDTDMTSTEKLALQR